MMYAHTHIEVIAPEIFLYVYRNYSFEERYILGYQFNSS